MTVGLQKSMSNGVIVWNTKMCKGGFEFESSNILPPVR